MIGAIIGDVVGSRFEFNNCKSKQFPFFDDTCSFTDDTVMTLAVAKALLCYDCMADVDAFKQELVKAMREIGGRYPYCGYGYRFCQWMFSDDPKPYNSFGNGSAMRVSPLAWFSSSLDECVALAAASAEITHNHPEGIKGAIVVAGAIYLARTTHSKEEIKAFTDRFYTIDFTLDEIRDTYGFYEICQRSVPQALEAFYESVNFEDAVRNAISIGGDSDTIAAITGSIAEAFYGVDETIKETALSYLDPYLLEIADSFAEQYLKDER